MAARETWVDAKGQVVYVKGSSRNREDRLTRQEFEDTKDLISGTVTRADGKVFYAPFRLAPKKSSAAARTFKGAVAAYKAALKDGWTHATSIYSKPWVYKKLSAILREREASEEDFEPLRREEWIYNPELGTIDGPTDNHTLDTIVSSSKRSKNGGRHASG